MRQDLGTAVFGAMLGVTLFGIFITPVFYFVIQWLSDKFYATQALQAASDLETAPPDLDKPHKPTPKDH
jgi:multidrug efflux pump